MPPITAHQRRQLEDARQEAVKLANKLTDSELATVVRFALYCELKDYRPSSIDPPFLWLPIPTLQAQMAAVIKDRHEQSGH